MRQNLAVLSAKVSVVPLRWEDAGALSRLSKAHSPLELIVGGDLLYRVQADTFCALSGHFLGSFSALSRRVLLFGQSV